jgi:1,4-dihydroxy-2-naphthoate octaprenyltransferase
MRVLDFCFAARPLLQLPIWTVYLVALHYHHLLSGERFAFLDLALMAMISIVFTAAAYLNQVYDFESDRINNKVGFLQRGFLSQNALMRGCLLCLVVPFVVSPFVSWLTLFIVAQLVFLAIVYSAPPPRLKDRPVGGLFANAYGHGFLVAVAVMPDMTLHNAGQLGWDLPFYFFFAVGATYVLTTIPDRIGDAASGKRTIAVILGRNGALWVAFALLGLAEASVRLAAKTPLLLLTLLAGFWYPVYLAFVVALLFGTRAYYRRRFGLIYPELA